MTPAEKLAALKALQLGIGKAIEQVEAEVESVRKITGARSFDTPLGTVTWTIRKPTVTYEPDAMLAWAKINMPHEVEVVERVRPTLAKTLEKRFITEHSEPSGRPIIVDTTTGEIVQWAHVRPGSESSTTRLTQEAKDNATAAILANLDTVTGVLTAGVAT